MVLIAFIFFGGIGAVLGLDALNLRMKSKGVLKVNISKLILLGIPSFLIPLIYVLCTIGLIRVSANMLLYFGYNSYILIVSSIILGHTIVSSFYKDDI